MHQILVKMLVKLGLDRENKPITTIIQNIGVWCIFAVSRYGKSTLIKNILCQIAMERQLVIFDYYQEEYEVLKYANFRSKNPMGIIRMETIQCSDFGFEITSFDKSDFMSLGLTSSGADIMMRLLRFYKEDDEKSIKKMYKMIMELEIAGTPEWHYGYPDYPLKKIHKSTIENIQKIIPEAIDRGFFLFDEDKREELTAKKLGHLFQLRKHVIFNMNLQEYSLQLVRAYTGKILELFLQEGAYLLKKYTPVIIVDEANKIFPKVPEEIVMPKNLLMGKEYLHKVQRFGVTLIVISQNPEEMAEGFFDYSLVRICGKGINVPDEKLMRYIRYLRCDLPTYREFALQVLGKPNILIFRPDENYNDLRYI